jgi:hypothetical protein
MMTYMHSHDKENCRHGRRSGSLNSA